MNHIATTSNPSSHLESEGWYYTRLLLQRGRPGHLKLDGTRLTFDSIGKHERPAGPYEEIDETPATVFALDLSEVHSLSYQWLTGSVVIAHAGGRHIVSLVGPSSGSVLKDFGRLGRGYSALTRWQSVLPSQPDVSAQPAPGAARGTDQGAGR
jgi:hypothetical protein